MSGSIDISSKKVCTSFSQWSIIVPQQTSLCRRKVSFYPCRCACNTLGCPAQSATTLTFSYPSASRKTCSVSFPISAPISMKSQPLDCKRGRASWQMRTTLSKPVFPPDKARCGSQSRTSGSSVDMSPVLMYGGLLTIRSKVGVQEKAVSRSAWSNWIRSFR